MQLSQHKEKNPRTHDLFVSTDMPSSFPNVQNRTSSISLSYLLNVERLIYAYLYTHAYT